MQALPYIPSLIHFSWNVLPYVVNHFSPDNRKRITSELAQRILLENLHSSEKVNLIDSEGDILNLQVTKTHLGSVNIEYNSVLERLDPHAFSFVFKHEIHHVKKAKGLAFKIGRLIQNTFFAYAFSCFFSPITTCILSTILIPTRYKMQKQYEEECKADEFAIQQSSLEEIKGGLRFFMAIQHVNKHLYSLNPEAVKDEIDENGNILGDTEHPPISKRIEKLAQQLNVGCEWSKEDTRLSSILAQCYLDQFIEEHQTESVNTSSSAIAQ